MESDTAWRSAVAGWVLLVGMLVPRLVGAGELDLGARAGVGYDSNVFNRKPAVDSAVVQFEASGEARDELEFGTYRIRYEPSYTINTSKDAKNFWDNRAYAEGTYVFSPRTRLTLSDSFAVLEKIVYRPNDPAPGPNSNIDDNNRRTTRNVLSLSGSHLLDPLTTLWADTDYSINRYDRSNDTDNDYLAGQGGVYRVLSPRLRLGAGGSLSYRSFDSSGQGTDCQTNNVGTGPGSRTLAYSGFLTGAYQFDPTTSLELRAGPAWLETTTYVCAQSALPPFNYYLRRTESQVTWFAEGTLAKDWRNVSAKLTYTRSEGLGGAGTSTVNDVLVGRVDWTPARFWDVGLRASWIQRTQQGVKQASGSQSSTDTTTWTVAGRVSRQILRHLRATLDASYRTQNQNRQGASSLAERDFNAYRILVGIDYRYDPIRY